MGVRYGSTQFVYIIIGHCVWLFGHVDCWSFWHCHGFPQACPTLDIFDPDQPPSYYGSVLENSASIFYVGSDYYSWGLHYFDTRNNKFSIILMRTSIITAYIQNNTSNKYSYHVFRLFASLFNKQLISVSYRWDTNERGENCQTLIASLFQLMFANFTPTVNWARAIIRAVYCNYSSGMI